jgi:Ca2+-binding RTX toxin-like protein
MPLILSTDDAAYTNDLTITGAPGVRMTGSRIRFTNSESGRVISLNNVDPAIIIEGNGGTIINMAGGVIRLDNPPSSLGGAAIIGSAGNDVVMNSGSIGGRVLLGGGNDEFHNLGDAVSGLYLVDLGAGDDLFYHAPSATGSASVFLEGGDGSDRLIVTGPRNTFGGTLTNVEILDIRTNGFFQGLIPSERIEVFFNAPDHNSTAIRFTNAASTDVFFGSATGIGGLAIYDRSGVRSITGDAQANNLQLGNDTVITGIIDLGGGNDVLSIFHSQFSNPVQSSIGSAILGGSGTDQLQLSLDGGDVFNASNVLGFESVFISNRGQGNQPTPPASSNVTVTGLSGMTEVRVFDASFLNTASPLSVTIASSALANATILLDRRVILNLESTVVAGSLGYLYGVPGANAVADDSLSLVVNNAGAILGNVNLYIGDDQYDGRLGSVGGTIFGYAGNDTILAGSGNDRIDGGAGGDTLNGGAGNDRLDGGTGRDTFVGGLGDDTFILDRADESVSELAGEGTDTIIIGVLSYALGANIENLIFSSVGVVSYQGNDLNNSIQGGSSGDDLYGLAGDDSLYGLGGNDYLSGNNGADYLSGGDGNDVFIGGAGVDIMVGGLGDDVFYAEGADIIVDYAGAGYDTINVNESYNLAAGSEIERLSTVDNFGLGNFTLVGNELTNLVIGNSGVNWIDGGAGSDTLYGLGGQDYFAFSTALGASNVDVIADFSSVDDLFFLDRRIFTAMTTGYLDASAFLSGAGATAATTAAQRIIYNSTTGDVYYDADGAGGAAAVKFATIGAGNPAFNTDFYVY